MTIPVAELNAKPSKKRALISSLLLSALSAGLVGFGASVAASAQETESDPFAFEHESCTGEPFQIKIIVTNVKQGEGQIVVDLYKNDPETFLKQAGQIVQTTFPALKDETYFCIHAPEADVYAVAVFHDKNSNMILDKGNLGIPVEKWGVSLDTKKRFKAPPIEKTLFELDESGKNLTIKLRRR